MLSFISTTNTYAQSKNARFSSKASNIIPLHQRWAEKVGELSPEDLQTLQYNLNSAVKEIKLNYPTLNTWEDLELAQSIEVALDVLNIDTTMQRELDLWWVSTILRHFDNVKVQPMQVYIDPDDGKMCVWEGQHTAIVLWFVCVHILKIDPKDCKVPVVIYKSNLKSKMRNCFIGLNGDSKKGLDLIDYWDQYVFGVRIDGEKNPEWVKTERKQAVLEKHGLFVTHDKFNDSHMPGAISRLQEINKLPLESVEWLALYLSIVTAGKRPAVEKEMVMMGKFFDLCRHANIKIDKSYVVELAHVTDTLFGADFMPNGKFWTKAATAYYNWHNSMGFDSFITPRFNKEPVHGMPFLLAQLRKSFSRPVPLNQGNSPFTPAAKDLF